MEFKPSTALSKLTVLLVHGNTRTIRPEQWNRVQQKFNISIYDCTDVDEFCNRLAPGGLYCNTNAIFRTGWRKAEPYAANFLYTAEVAKYYLPPLKLIVSSGHSHDEADMDTLTQMGIWYCNMPDICTEAVANTALYLILSAYRHLTFAEYCAQNDWAMSRSLGMKTVDPLGSILGIVGLGSISTRIARKTTFGLGMKLCYFNRRRDVEREEQVGADISYCQSLEELLKISDWTSTRMSQGSIRGWLMTTWQLYYHISGFVPRLAGMASRKFAGTMQKHFLTLGSR